MTDQAFDTLLQNFLDAYFPDGFPSGDATIRNWRPPKPAPALPLDIWRRRNTHDDCADNLLHRFGTGDAEHFDMHQFWSALGIDPPLDGPLTISPIRRNRVPTIIPPPAPPPNGDDQDDDDANGPSTPPRKRRRVARGTPVRTRRSSVTHLEPHALPLLQPIARAPGGG